jgi:ornithine carbamoyltransferase
VSTDGIRHFLDLIDIPRKQLRDMIDVSRTMKKTRQRGRQIRSQARRCHDFRQASTRTRVSFDVGIRQLGGESITLTGQEMQLGRGEPLLIPHACCRATSTPS